MVNKNVCFYTFEQARLLSVSEQWEITSEEPENLEITEDENERRQTSSSRDEESPHPDRVQQSNYLLASMIIHYDQQEEKEKCPLWTRGLQRSFKVRFFKCSFNLIHLMDFY
jgi:hypothetical protein